MKTVLISGGTSGIGKASVLQLLRDGFNVSTFSRDDSKCKSLEKELARDYEDSRFLVLAADVTDEGSLLSFVRAVAKKFGSIDILINNAGFGYFSECDSFDMGHFKRLIDTNLIGVAMLTNLAVPYMKRKKSGQIINIASMSGKRSYPKGEFYSSTKFAVMGYSDGIRKELEEFGIKVSTICPGLVETNFFGDNYKKMVRKQGKTMMAPEDISRIVSLICRQSKHSDIQDVSVLPF